MKRFIDKEFFNTPIALGKATCIDNKVEYAINEKTGKVTAYIKNTKYHPIEYLISTKTLSMDSPFFNFQDRNFQAIKNHLVIDSSYSGRAQLHPDDDWDVEEGKRIAKARCLCKYNNAMAEALYHFCDYMYNKCLRAYDVQNSFCDAAVKWYKADPRNSES